MMFVNLKVNFSTKESRIFVVKKNMNVAFSFVQNSTSLTSHNILKQHKRGSHLCMLHLL